MNEPDRRHEDLFRDGDDLPGDSDAEPTVPLPDYTVPLPDLEEAAGSYPGAAEPWAVFAGASGADHDGAGRDSDAEPTVALTYGMIDPGEGIEPTVALTDDVVVDFDGGAEATVALPEQFDPHGADEGAVLVEEAVLEASTGGVFTGPVRLLTWAIAAGWLVLAGFGLVAMSPPAGWLIGGLALVGAAVTGWLGWTMVVRWDEHGIILPGRGPTPWSDVDEVSLQPGLLSVPQVELHTGRSIQAIPLDALAWFGKGGTSLRLAQRVADHADAGEVRVVEPSRRRGTRAMTSD